MDKLKIHQNLCRNICYLRRTNKLTQKEMADIVGISVSTLRRIERGEASSRVNGRMLCRVCDYFDISADAMIKSDLEAEGVMS